MPTSSWAIFKEHRELKEQLSASFNGLVATRSATKEARKVWEEERSYVTDWERRVVASNKESEEYHTTLKRFNVRYPKFKVNEDPFVELPSDTEVPFPIEVPFDDRPTTPLLGNPARV
ncbi:hypothetical protein BHM03_00022312 [Ensete ventricosum]|nr:hypothetical protein BHM03_00022312 [Ensete ventricosum]